jgi:hypothetical protein
VEIKFCESGDRKIAVGTGKRPIRWCRECYIEQCGPEFEEWNVVINHRELDVEPEQLGVACAKTGNAVAAGSVWLDPVETNILALVYMGFIEAIPAAKAPAKAAKTEA